MQAASTFKVGQSKKKTTPKIEEAHSPKTKKTEIFTLLLVLFLHHLQPGKEFLLAWFFCFCQPPFNY